MRHDEPWEGAGGPGEAAAGRRGGGLLGLLGPSSGEGCLRKTPPGPGPVGLFGARWPWACLSCEIAWRPSTSGDSGCGGQGPGPFRDFSEALLCHPKAGCLPGVSTGRRFRGGPCRGHRAREGSWAAVFPPEPARKPGRRALHCAEPRITERGPGPRPGRTSVLGVQLAHGAQQQVTRALVNVFPGSEVAQRTAQSGKLQRGGGAVAGL